MTDAHETIADIIAEMRDEAARADMEQGYSLDDAAEMMREFASRVDAAAKRMEWAHKKELETRDAVIQTEVAAREAEQDAHKREMEAVGDARKLGAALLEIRDAMRVYMSVGGISARRTIEMAFEIARDALAAPPRNCDRFATVDEARKAHEAICEKYGKCHHGCPLNNEEHYSAFDCFEAWLFAPAKEKKGGDDGNE